MKNIVINGNEYTLEYTFAAAEHKATVQKMFDVVSGAYLIKRADNGSDVASALIDGAGEMVADVPHIVRTAFYSGLLENHKVSEDEAYELMKAYMKENKISFKKLFDDIKECMENDGFFDLSGLTDMMKEVEEKTSKRAKEKKNQKN